jgi:hypothetical protein
MVAAATRAGLTLTGHASPNGHAAHGGAPTPVARHHCHTDSPDQDDADATRCPHELCEARLHVLSLSECHHPRGGAVGGGDRREGEERREEKD